LIRLFKFCFFVYRADGHNIKPNGPAIKGGCVTWRCCRPAVPICFSREILPVARQVWRAFCRPVVNFIGFRRGRGTMLLDGQDFLPVDEVGKGQWRSFAT